MEGVNLDEIFQKISDDLNKLRSYKLYNDCVEDKGVEYYVVKQNDLETRFQMNHECKKMQMAFVKYSKKIFNDSRWVFMIPAITGIVFNILIITAFAIFKQARTSNNMYIVSIAAADILVIINFFIDEFGNFSGLQGFVLYTVPFTLIAMSAERYKRIRRCIQCPSEGLISQKKRGALKTIILVWTIAVCFAIADHFIKEEAKTIKNIFSLGTKLIVPALLICIINSHLFWIIRKTVDKASGENENKNKERGNKKYRILIFLIVNFCITFGIHHIIYRFVLYYRSNIFVLDEDTLYTVFVFERISTFMIILNANFNPIISYFTVLMFQKCINKLVYMIRNCKVDLDIDHDNTVTLSKYSNSTKPTT